LERAKENHLIMDAADQPLTLPQLAEVAGVEYARLHSWLKRGLVRASVQTSTGTGRPNLFSKEDALRARILGDLDRAGVSFKSLQKTAEKLNAHSEFLQGEGVLSVNGTVEFFSSSQSMAEIKEPGVVYPLSLARAATEQALSSS
jgi:DNA-binding transcriptional MerR regulator